jgi:hypothetical protein
VDAAAARCAVNLLSSGIGGKTLEGDARVADVVQQRAHLIWLDPVLAHDAPELRRRVARRLFGELLHEDGPKRFSAERHADSSVDDSSSGSAAGRGRSGTAAL